MRLSGEEHSRQGSKAKAVGWGYSCFAGERGERSLAWLGHSEGAGEAQSQQGLWPIMWSLVDRWDDLGFYAEGLGGTAGC